VRKFQFDCRIAFFHFRQGLSGDTSPLCHHLGQSICAGGEPALNSRRTLATCGKLEAVGVVPFCRNGDNSSARFYPSAATSGPGNLNHRPYPWEELKRRRRVTPPWLRPTQTWEVIIRRDQRINNSNTGMIICSERVVEGQQSHDLAPLLRYQRFPIFATRIEGDLPVHSVVPVKL
jgi:hypothetical protein